MPLYIRAYPTRERHTHMLTALYTILTRQHQHARRHPNPITLSLHNPISLSPAISLPPPPPPPAACRLCRLPAATLSSVSRLRCDRGLSSASRTPQNLGQGRRSMISGQQALCQGVCLHTRGIYSTCGDGAGTAGRTEAVEPPRRCTRCAMQCYYSSDLITNRVDLNTWVRP